MNTQLSLSVVTCLQKEKKNGQYKERVFSLPERVFSLLNNSFNSQQCSSLEDYIEASLMLQYNH